MEGKNMQHFFPIEATPEGVIRTSHCTDGLAMCWCKPEVKQVCKEANDHGVCMPDCWACDGRGLVEPYFDELTYYVIHRRHQLAPELRIPSPI